MVTSLKRDTGGPAEKHRQPCKEFYHENQPSQTLRRSAGRGADHVLRFIFEKRRPPNRRYRRREKRDEMQTILIIDDDAAIGNLEQEVLERAGYAVQRAYSGTEALLLLRSSRPDLILLDLMLPGLSGEEVLPKIQGIPVIVVSARAAVQDKVDLLLGGAADYLTKPFDTKELLARVAVRLREALLAFLGSWALTMLSTLSVGMLVGGVAKDVKQASVIASILYFPMLIFSGTTLPIEVMPTVMQKIVSVFPLTQGITMMKHAFLGISTGNVLLPVCVMLGLTALCTIFAVRFFRWDRVIPAAPYSLRTDAP